MEQEIFEKQKIWVQNTLDSCADLLGSAQRLDVWRKEEKSLRELLEIEQTIFGLSNDTSTLPDSSPAQRLDSLPQRALAQVEASISQGTLRTTCDEIQSKIDTADKELRNQLEVQAGIENWQRRETWLESRLAELTQKLATDQRRTLQSESLREHYDALHKLAPDQIHELIERKLHPLCQDAILEIIVWKIHIRPELDQISSHAKR